SVTGDPLALGIRVDVAALAVGPDVLARNDPLVAGRALALVRGHEDWPEPAYRPGVIDHAAHGAGSFLPGPGNSGVRARLVEIVFGVACPASARGHSGLLASSSSRVTVSEDV